MIKATLPLAWALLTSASVWGAEFTVNSETDGTDLNPGDGVCEVSGGGGDCSLRAAIMETNALGGAHSVNLPAGVFALTIAGNESESAAGDLNILGTELTLAGAGQADSIIDGNGSNRVMTISVADVLLRDLTIRNGAGTATSALGGAISMFGGPTPNTLTLRRVHLTNNSANAGGALFAADNGVLTIEDSLFTENTTVPLGVTNQNGPAIYCLGCTLDVSGSTFTANHVGGKTITAHTDAVVRVINSTISSNDEGGIYTQNADALIKFSTLANNGAQNLAHFSFDDSKFMQVGGSVLQSDNSSDCQTGGDLPASLGNNVVGDDSCEFAGTGDLQNSDALLGPLQDNAGPTLTQLPGTGSPAIDQVPAAACTDLSDAPLTRDQRGLVRPIGSNCDAGAVEVLSQLLLQDGFESD